MSGAMGQRVGTAVALGLIALSAEAIASSVGDEIGVASTLQTAQNPQSGSITELLIGELDVSEATQLRVDLGFTHVNAAPPLPGSAFGYSGADVFSGSLSGEWNPTETWQLGGNIDYSPSSQSTSGTSVPFPPPQQPVEAEIAAQTSSVGLGALVEYNTAGDSDFETSVDGTAGFTRYDTAQQVNQVPDRSAVLRYCSGKLSPAAAKACRTLRTALRGQAAELTQGKLGLGVNETIFVNTDLGATFSYYLYDSDPNQFGYFSNLAIGRTAQIGSGASLQPLQWSIRPDIAHRFGALMVDLWYLYGPYVRPTDAQPGAEDGWTHAVGIKVQYKFSKAIKAYLKVSGELDRDNLGNQSTSTAFAIGLRWIF